MTDAYAAGLIDGEGCLTITKDSRKAWFYVRIDVGMTVRALPVLNLLKTTYGGNVRLFRKATDRWDEAHAWNLCGRPAIVMLQRIHPYLYIKSEQARLCLCLQRMVDALPRTKSGRAQWSEEVRSKAATLHLMVQELNRKGSQTIPEPGWFARVAGDHILTPQQDMLSDLGFTQFSETFPESGFWENGYIYERPTSALRILGNAFFYSRPEQAATWPTPTVGESDNDPRPSRAATNRKTDPRSEDSESAGNHPGVTDSLTGAKRNWATPNVPNGGRTTNSTDRREDGSTRQIDLGAQAQLWQTPATDSFRSRGGDRKDEMGLDQQARMFDRVSSAGTNLTKPADDTDAPIAKAKGWPTPKGRDSRSAEGPAGMTRHDPDLNVIAANFRPSPPDPQTPAGPESSETTPGSRRLSPVFVEWLLGLPLFYTEIP